VNRFSDWWFTHVNRWYVLGVVVLFGVFGATVLPAQARRAEEYAGAEGGPDTQLLYTSADLYAAAERFGAEGRDAYVTARYTFDVVWPLVYALFLCVLLTVVLRALFPEGDRRRRLNLLPWAAVAADYLENLATATVIARYPDTTDVVAALAPIFSLTKWLLVIGSFVVLIVLAIDLGIKRVRRRA
jgi:hypothetical protein